MEVSSKGGEVVRELGGGRGRAVAVAGMLFRSGMFICGLFSGGKYPT